MSVIFPGPDTVIAGIHELGVQLGFRRLRIDRSGRGGTEERPNCWFEVGYGCKEIKVRFYSRGSEHGIEPYRATWDRVDLDEIARRLCTLIDLSEGGNSGALIAHMIEGDSK